MKNWPRWTNEDRNSNLSNFTLKFLSLSFRHFILGRRNIAFRFQLFVLVILTFHLCLLYPQPFLIWAAPPVSYVRCAIIFLCKSKKDKGKGKAKQHGFKEKVFLSKFPIWQNLMQFLKRLLLQNQVAEPTKKSRKGPDAASCSSCQ